MYTCHTMIWTSILFDAQTNIYSNFECLKEHFEVQMSHAGPLELHVGLASSKDARHFTLQCILYKQSYFKSAQTCKYVNSAKGYESLNLTSALF